MTRDELAQLTLDEEQRREIPAASPVEPALGSLADQSMSPHEIAAARVAQAARPAAGRLEGAATELPWKLMTDPLKKAQGFIQAGMNTEQFPMQTMAPGEQRTISTDYDPRRRMGDLAAETSLNLTGLPALSPAPIAPAGALGIFAGRRAATSDPAMFTLARRMEKEGATPSAIMDATADLPAGRTGLEKLADKKYRYEISDAGSSVNQDVLNKAPMIGAGGSDVGFPMSTVFNHPELYQAYPHMKDIEVKRLPDIAGIRGGYDPAANQIFLNEKLSPKEAREVLLHELQHSVQNFEKFAQGGSQYMEPVMKRGKQIQTEVFNETKQRLNALMAERAAYVNEKSSGTATGSRRDALEKQWGKENPDLLEGLRIAGKQMNDVPTAARFEAYRRLVGEAEARNTAKRADLSIEERFLKRPETTEDIPREKQWPYREKAATPSSSLQLEQITPGEILRPPGAAPRYTKLGGEVNLGVDAPTNKRIQTVRDPYRMMYPGIYGNPKEIAAEAASRVIPEDPAMKRLWGVSRGDLDEMARSRVGNEPPKGVIPSERGRGSLAAQNVMIPKNEQRLIDTLIEGGRYPGLKHADAWYIFDPVFQRLEQMHGPEEAVKRFRHLNTMTGMASPGSDVLTEIQRGTAAHWLERQGRFGEFLKYGGVPEVLPKNAKPGAVSRETLGAEFPADLGYMAAHPYHSTSQALPMSKYLERGELRSENPKVPLYVHASGVPQTGFQTTAPVGDAHFSRGVGLADTRKGPTDVGASFSRPEYETMAPWWREKVAGKVGVEAVPGQARLWTVLGPQTGVESPLGQGKLELFSQQIVKAAHRLGISPEKARDLILSGGAGAGVLTLAAPKLGELADQSGYKQ